jgi:CRISPR-associated protein Cas1
VGDRIIEIAERPARVKTRLSQLVLHFHEPNQEITAPIEELGALVVANPQVTYTHAALAALASAGVALIVCDDRHMPSGVLLPFQGHFVQQERLRAQIEAGEPRKKRLWQQIVRAKIANQAAVLRELRGAHLGLARLVRQVQSGDPRNVEAQAARMYWPILFDDPEFRRRPEACGVNGVLNYGYAALRAMTARALCASGLHPSLGLHHRNRYDAFALADDLMEPLRPAVDRAVAVIAGHWGLDAEITKETKREVLGALTSQVEIDGERRSVVDALGRMSASLARALAGDSLKLALPRF